MWVNFEVKPFSYIFHPIDIVVCLVFSVSLDLLIPFDLSIAYTSCGMKYSHCNICRIQFYLFTMSFGVFRFVFQFIKCCDVSCIHSTTNKRSSMLNENIVRVNKFVMFGGHVKSTHPKNLWRNIVIEPDSTVAWNFFLSKSHIYLYFEWKIHRAWTFHTLLKINTRFSTCFIYCELRLFRSSYIKYVTVNWFWFRIKFHWLLHVW